jgi:hypothetical protein
MDIIKILKDYKKEATDTTIKKHYQNLLFISKSLNKDIINNKDIFNNFEEIKKKIIDDDKTIFTKRNKISSIIVFLKAIKEDNNLINKYSELLEILSNRIDKTKFKKNNKDNDKWMPMKEINNYLVKLKYEIPNNILTYSDLVSYMKYISLYFHLNVEAIRCDLSETEIYKFELKEYDDNINYLILDTDAKYIMNNFKTKKSYDQIIININDEQKNELVKYYNSLISYKEINQINNNYMFILKNGNKMTRSHYSKFFINIFSDSDKSLNVNMLRKITASENCNIKNIKNKSDRMGHSIETHLKYYVKE